jgi:hypothetical protein
MQQNRKLSPQIYLGALDSTEVIMNCTGPQHRYQWPLRSKVKVCGHLFAGIADSNPAKRENVLFSFLCVVQSSVTATS